ncbi:MAG: CorA family divalent cation transporter [Rhodocyclaceae bacterium]|nr:CorA family divalent cation transporter [Rhodocyclaceae bacterium]
MGDKDTEKLMAEGHFQDVLALLERYRRVEDLVHRQEMPRHDLVETLVHRQHVAGLAVKLESLPTAEVAFILEALPEADRLLAWQQVREDRCEEILEKISDAVREELVSAQAPPKPKIMLNAFELHNGRLRQIPVENRDELAQLKPIWVDLVAPTAHVRQWVGELFGLDIPDPDQLTDLEATARFYVEEEGDIHLTSDFLLDLEDRSRNVAVAFILHGELLISVRKEELPVFRLQRLRARTQPGYVSSGKDVLLDLYAADAEYSADALEDVYASLEAVGKQVLDIQITDEQAAQLLAAIAQQEDLNGRIRRNVLDTRRAVSFLMRGKFLDHNQQEDARQILRDIESLDGHTSFLFGKINFLMDATIGFININQNRRVNQLTVFGVVFMPINILAGVGGMSEFSMMTQGIPWPLAYGCFMAAMGMIGWGTYTALKYSERRKVRQAMKDRLLAGSKQ